MKKTGVQSKYFKTLRLWTKLRHISYLQSHYLLFLIYMLIMFLRDCIFFVVALFLFGIFSTDIIFLFKLLF